MRPADKRIGFVAMVVNAKLSTVTHANEWYILNKGMHKLSNDKVLEHFRDHLESTDWMMEAAPYGVDCP